MELLLDINELSDITNNSLDESFQVDEEKQIKNVLQLDGVERLERVNICPGADVLTILVIINTIVNTFHLPKRIKDGYESWKGIIMKIKDFISKKQLVSIDEEGVELLAIDYIVANFDCNTADLVDSHVINITDLSGMINSSSELAKRPHNYYIQTYRLDGEETIILGMRSDGEVKLIKHFGLSNYGFEEIN